MNLLVGISGSVGVLGIHSYLIRLLARPGLSLRAVMTPTAARFVSPSALGAVIGSDVLTDSWPPSGRAIAAPDLAAWADAYLIAPASATTISSCASGSADTLVCACYLAFKGSATFAPVMSPDMLGHPAVARNIAQLERDGARVLPTASGYSVQAGNVDAGGLCDFKTLLEAVTGPADRQSAA